MKETQTETTRLPQILPYQDKLVILLKTVKSLGITVDIVILDIILALEKEIMKKGKSISIDDIEKISNVVVSKYQEQPKQ